VNLSPDFGWLLVAGFIAQLVGRSAGMGYGLTASTFLAALGLPPALASATVHGAVLVRCGVLATANGWFRHLHRRILLSLLLPGVAGAVIGASLLTQVAAEKLRPLVWAYLLVTSLFVLGRILLSRAPLTPGATRPALGAAAGTLDAIGGGGWGTLIASGMVARGMTQEVAVATATAAEVFVAAAVSVTLGIHFGLPPLDLVAALLIGGALGTPLASWVIPRVPQRAAVIPVALVVFALGTTGLVTSLT
jgi:uncharacterized protein